MILSFKQNFNDGTPTNFKEKILAFEKIHTLRDDNLLRWQATTKIQMATGVRTKFYNQFNKGIDSLSICTAVFPVFMSYYKELVINIDGIKLEGDKVTEFIKNDGLTYERFLQWFFPKGHGSTYKRLIQWTDFRY